MKRNIHQAGKYGSHLQLIVEYGSGLLDIALLYWLRSC